MLSNTFLVALTSFVAKGSTEQVGRGQDLGVISYCEHSRFGDSFVVECNLIKAKQAVIRDHRAALLTVGCIAMA